MYISIDLVTALVTGNSQWQEWTVTNMEDSSSGRFLIIREAGDHVWPPGIDPQIIFSENSKLFSHQTCVRHLDCPYFAASAFDGEVYWNTHIHNTNLWSLTPDSCGQWHTVHRCEIHIGDEGVKTHLNTRGEPGSAGYCAVYEVGVGQEEIPLGRHPFFAPM